jgi:hypothetical protein
MVLIDGKLAAVLSRLSSDHENAGHWFLECGFGPIARCEVEFEDLNQAKSWIAKQLGD